MCSYVQGYRPPDDTFRKMERVFDACTEAGVDLPAEVSAFFGDEPPDPAGVEVPLGEAVTRRADPEGTREGFQVDLTKVPDGVRHIVFWNAW